jgi:hypothetical protein
LLCRFRSPYTCHRRATRPDWSFPHLHSQSAQSASAQSASAQSASAQSASAQTVKHRSNVSLVEQRL